MLRKLILLLAVLMFPLASTNAQVCKLNSDIFREISSHYAGFHLLQTSDLSDDDRAMWQARRKGQCPGLVRIPAFERTAALLVSKAEKRFVVISYRRTAGRTRSNVQTVTEGTFYVNPPVIAQVSERASQNLKRSTDNSSCAVLQRNSAVVLEFIESSATAYSLNHADCKVELIQ